MAGSEAARGAVAAGPEVRPLAAHVGAEIVGLDLRNPLGDNFALVDAAWKQHCVLLFRDQDLSEDHQVAFAERFGPLAKNVNRNSGQSKANPSTMLISNIRENGKLVGALPDGEMLFHSDQCYIESPCKGALLYGIEIPSRGGDTVFANMYAAWETLPEALKQAVLGRKAINIFEYNEDAGYGASAMELYPEVPAGAKAYAHPVVREHPETGRRALYVNRGMTVCIEGMERAESDALLKQIFDHQERPEFQYSHQWRVGDLLLWDNRCTLHARTDFPADERRLLRRVTLVGDKPF